MKTLQELKEIRDRMQKQMNLREASGSDDIRIVVGMATCGIAAGARSVLNRLNEEVQKRNLRHVKVIQTGCIGMCRFEPIVEVYIPGQEKVTYVKVTENDASKIVSDHIVNGNIVRELLVQKD